MHRIEIRLFGQSEIRLADGRLVEIENGKGEMLLCYLLVHPERPHAREALATLLWNDSSDAQARKYLRQALWQLNQTFGDAGVGAAVVADSTWVRLSDDIDWQLDLADFNRRYLAVRDIPGRALTDDEVAAIRYAISLYRGELLARWYDDWCLYERERLQQMYLALLEKLLDHCLANQSFEEGRQVADIILRFDRAHERTHRRMMQLYDATGNRSAALRQFRQCKSALEEELGVAPSRRTTRLYRRICADGERPAVESTVASLPDVLKELRSHLSRLDRMQQQLNYDIHRLESALTAGGAEA